MDTASTTEETDQVLRLIAIVVPGTFAFVTIGLIASILINGRRRPATRVGSNNPPPANTTPPGTGRSWSFSRIPTWVFAVAIVAGLAYFFWSSSLPSTDSVATTAAEVGEKMMEGSDNALATSNDSFFGDIRSRFLEDPLFTIVTIIVGVVVILGLYKGWKIATYVLQSAIVVIFLIFIVQALEKYELKKLGPEVAAEITHLRHEAAVAEARAEAKEELENALGKTTSSAAQQPVERVVSDYFTIPAKGKIVVSKKLRCSVDNLNEEEMKYVSVENTKDSFDYTSTHSAPIDVKIWFFDEGGTCKDDHAKLKTERMFK